MAGPIFFFVGGGGGGGAIIGILRYFCAKVLEVSFKVTTL